MATETQERALNRQIFNAVFQKLGPRYKASQVTKSNLAIAIVESAPPGQQFENGRNLRLLGGVTNKQLAVVRETSETVTEAAQRIIDFVLNKKDTITVRPQREREIQEITEAVTQNVLAAIQKLVGGKVSDQEPKVIPEDYGVGVTHEDQGTNTEVPRGIQGEPPRKRSSILEEAARKAESKEDEVKLWNSRAALAGLGEPPLTKLGHVDGRWIRKNKPLWEQYLASQ